MTEEPLFSVVLYSALGVMAIGYALSQLGVIHLPSLTSSGLGRFHLVETYSDYSLCVI